MKHLARKTAVGVIALVLPFTAAACGKSDSDSSSTTAAKDMTTTTVAGDMGATTDMGTSTGSEPFGSACASVPKDGAGSFAGMAQDPVATAASNNPALSTLVQAVTAAKLGDTLNSAQDITVFAPTNDAFKALDPATLKAAMDDPTGLLTKVLQNHVVAGRLTPEDLAGEHKTLGGGTIKVEGSGESFTVDGTAKVVCGNVQTANATVYIIDSVLLPS
jgi:uncharacterized surface protein with fasciclin (FAS1) repeats